ncbi:MAG: 16S rRNA (uracil(1498)-N(3))-methyltransferase [Bacteroidales bacterium]|nr:16S rRNA (uracil(1498)-N(3))-methyltransferase [Bacteroidales bacterium]
MELFYSTEIRKETVLLRGQEADHCARVLRHKAGDTVFVIDGKGGLYNCTVVSLNVPKRGDAEVECRIVEKSEGVGGRPYRLVMAVCPTKNMDRYEWFAEKATELGVDAIVPLISDHSIRTTVKKERLEALVLSATKQSLKSVLPVVEDAVSVSDFLLRDFGEGTLKLIAHCEEGEKKTVREYVSTSQKPLNVVIMIGPEGDFSEREIALAREKGFLPLTLGPSRLRVETAAVVSVSEIYFASLQR